MHAQASGSESVFGLLEACRGWLVSCYGRNLGHLEACPLSLLEACPGHPEAKLYLLNYLIGNVLLHGRNLVRSNSILLVQAV